MHVISFLFFYSRESNMYVCVFSFCFLGQLQPQLQSQLQSLQCYLRASLAAAVGAVSTVAAAAVQCSECSSGSRSSIIKAGQLQPQLHPQLHPRQCWLRQRIGSAQQRQCSVSGSAAAPQLQPQLCSVSYCVAAPQLKPQLQPRQCCLRQRSGIGAAAQRQRTV